MEEEVPGEKGSREEPEVCLQLRQMPSSKDPCLSRTRKIFMGHEGIIIGSQHLIKY